MLKMSKKKEVFFEEHRELNDENYKLELLYSQQIISNKLERVRSNLSFIVWVIVISIILAIVATCSGSLLLK